jgi:hypothetical protein
MTSATTSYRGVVLLAICCLSWISVVSAHEKFNITASARAAQTGVLVHFALKNVGDSPLQILRSDLPWDPHSTGLVVYWGRGGLGHSLDRWYTVQDTPGVEVTVLPGAEISGDMDLSLYFPDLKKIHDFSDLVIFWVYRPPSSKQQPQFGGMLLVSP